MHSNGIAHAKKNEWPKETMVHLHEKGKKPIDKCCLFSSLLRCCLSTRKRVSALRATITDWLFLAILGINVAFLSIAVDMAVYYFQKVQKLSAEIYSPDVDEFWLWLLSLITWMCYTISLVVLSASFVHYVAPQAIGSGIPEMKTIIRGVVLKDYLALKTLVSKVVGIAMSLGSGVPIGKTGPFVHIASVVANQMCLLASKLDVAYREDSRRMECLAAASAVGVACTFSSPVGGVLFSIEVTTMYFSVRSYWRGFFAACCGATTIRLLRGYVAQTEVTVNAFFQTSFPPDAFSVSELPLFALLGLICGILGAVYIYLYRSIVLFLRNNKYAKKLFQQHWVVYPIVVSFAFCTISYPHGIGVFSTGRIKFGMNLLDFFSNCSFTAKEGERLSCGKEVFMHWLDRDQVLLFLLLFVVVHFLFSIICITLPVPSGIFLPIFVLGAAIGRLAGEITRILNPTGTLIYPGIYAVVGAASFSASVTHTVSVSVMIFEITGQLHFILPVMIAVVVANAVCIYLQPSFFDTIIKIKHLPFLPDISPTSHVFARAHTILAENIMVSPVIFITKTTTYQEIREIIAYNFRFFPVVDSKSSQLLIGTVSRRLLMKKLNSKIGEEARHIEAELRVKQAIREIDRHFKDSQNEIIKRSHSDTNLPTFEPKVFLRDADRKASRTFLEVPPVYPISVAAANANQHLASARRNAFCSMQQDDESANHDDPGDGKAFSSHPMAHRTVYSLSHEYHTLLKNYMKNAKKYLYHVRQHKKVHEEENYDLSPREREVWERRMLAEKHELNDSDIDPSPFQLVNKTSLHRIHSIFSMLQLNTAYVTDCGRLCGVVALSDVRRALEKSQERSEDKQPTEEVKLDSGLATILSMPFKPSAQIIDILTPTLEIVRGNSSESLNVPDNLEILTPKATMPMSYRSISRRPSEGSS